jgi:hypothetical protein
MECNYSYWLISLYSYRIEGSKQLPLESQSKQLALVAVVEDIGPLARVE